jgi:Putative Actinobacterial Holin-X, holin superfamily III
MPEEPSDLGKAVQEVSDKIRLLVSEEIALAKAEMSEKMRRLAAGAAVGAAAGVFVLAGLIYFLHAIAWLLYRIISDDGRSVWIGYIIVAGALFLLAALAGFVAARFIKRGTPPKPAMALEEAQLIRETLKAPHPGTPSEELVRR